MVAPTVTEFLAGGTDLMERRRSGVAAANVQRLAPTDAMRQIEWRRDGGAMIGAAITVDQLASDPRIRAAYPGLAAAAAGLATPEIRRMATIGGNLTQRSRCWYYRNPALTCLKKGGAGCPARGGNHLYGVAFDLGPCVAPHPSTLGAAFMAYEASVATSARPRLELTNVFGDGRDGSRDHQLVDGEVIQSVHMAAPTAGERAVYKRAIARAHAEWPLVEVVLRIAIDGDRVTMAKGAIGGVAPVPLRLAACEAALEGAAWRSISIHDLARQASVGANPLPMTGYKVALIEGLVADALGDLMTQAG